MTFYQVLNQPAPRIAGPDAVHSACPALTPHIDGSGLKGGEFRLPSGVWADKQGRIFIADMFNGRVVVFQFIRPGDA